MIVVTDQEETALLAILEARAAPSKETLGVMNILYRRLVDQRDVRESYARTAARDAQRALPQMVDSWPTPTPPGAA